MKRSELERIYAKTRQAKTYNLIKNKQISEVNCIKKKEKNNMKG